MKAAPFDRHASFALVSFGPDRIEQHAREGLGIKGISTSRGNELAELLAPLCFQNAGLVTQRLQLGIVITYLPHIL